MLNNEEGNTMKYISLLITSLLLVSTGFGMEEKDLKTQDKAIVKGNHMSVIGINLHPVHRMVGIRNPVPCIIIIEQDRKSVV